MFGSILMASVRSTPTSLEQTRSRSCHQDKPAASLHWDGCACFYINRQALWQRVWLGGGPQIPLKVHSLLSRCLFEDRKSNKGGGRWRVVCCRFCTSFCLCRYHDAAKRKKEKKKKKKVVLPSDVGRNKSPRCGLNKNYLPNMIQSLSINKMKKKRRICCCFSVCLLFHSDINNKFHSQPNSSLVLAASCLSMSAAMLSAICWICVGRERGGKKQK